MFFQKLKTKASQDTLKSTVRRPLIRNGLAYFGHNSENFKSDEKNYQFDGHPRATGLLTESHVKFSVSVKNFLLSAP